MKISPTGPERSPWADYALNFVGMIDDTASGAPEVKEGKPMVRFGGRPPAKPHQK